MANLPIKTFLGLRTGVADPEMGTAGIAKNYRRNRVRGQLELADGTQNNLAFTPTTYGMQGGVVTPLAFRSFYVADQGGRVITAMLASYTKIGLGFAPTPVPSAGIFLRPYYSGGAWVDDWQEVTEFQILQFTSALAAVITTPNTGLGANYLAGWTLLRDGDFTNNDNTGFYVTASTSTTITITGDAADLGGWNNGTTVFYALRNVLNKVIPNSVVVNFRNVLDELRVNTGNTTNDLDVSVFYRDKTFFPGATRALKGTFAEYGQLTVPTRAFALLNLTVNTGAPGVAGFPAGTYSIKCSIQMDDGQETELRNVLGGTFPALMSIVSETVLGGGAGYSMATDGTTIYACTAAQSSPGYIFKLDSTNVLQKTVACDITTDWNPVAVTCKNGFVYVLKVNGAQTYVRLDRYDSALLSYTSGTAQILTAGYNTSIKGIANDNYFYFFSQPFASDHHQLLRFSLVTLNIDAIGANYAGTFSAPYMAADNSYVIIPGYLACYKYSATFAGGASPVSNVYVGMGSVTTSAATILAGIAYVGAGNILKKWVLSTDTITNLATGLTASDWFGMTNDGTYIIGTNGLTLRKYDVTGVPITSYTMASGNTYALISRGSNIFGYASATNSRMFANVLAASSFVSDGYLTPGFDLAVSAGYVPRRASKVNVYLSKDGGAYYLLKSYSILTGGETFGASSVFDATLKHRYYTSVGKVMTPADYSAASTSALQMLGRTDADAGTNRYSYAITANNRTYAVGLFIGGRLIRNKVYLDSANTSGFSMFDVLPNDVQYVLDVEFNDGDYCVALGNVADRVLVLKNRSLVLLTPTQGGEHQRDIVATGIGIAAVNSLVNYNEALYWLDHSGVWQFSTSGLKKMSAPIDADLFQLTNAQRAAAIACVDPKNSQYRILINGIIYVCDLADGEWTQEDGLSQLWFDQDIGFGKLDNSVGLQNAAASRRYAQLVGTNVGTPIEDTFIGTSTWETSKIELPLERGYDGLMSALYIDYVQTGANIIVTLGLYLDESGSAVKSYTLPAGKYEVTVPAPLAARAKTFRLRVTSVTTATGQKLKIRRMGAYFVQQPVGGDIQQV